MFTTKVFNTDIFDKYLAHLKDKSCYFLEIGTFEGRSTAYLLDNWPKCNVHTIDPAAKYPIPGYEDYIPLTLTSTIEDNLQPYTGRCVYFKAYSQDVFKTYSDNTFDMVFVDGDHRALSVYNDLVEALRVVKKDGIIIADDYRWLPKWETVAGNYNMYSPHWGIDSFIADYASAIEVMAKEYVVVLRKL